MKVQNSKLTRWFLHCLYTYASIFVIVTVLVLLLYGQFVRSVEQTVKDNYERQIISARESIVQSVNRAAISAAMLREDESVQRLSHATSESLPDEVMFMRAAHSALEKTYSQMGEEYLALYLLFPGNDYLVSNGFVSNDYRKEFGSRFLFGDMTAEEWRDMTLNASAYYITLGASSALYTGAGLCQTLPLYIPLQSATYTGRLAQIVYCLDADWCRGLLETEENIRVCLTTADGTPLLGTLETNEHEYLLLKVSNDVAPRFVMHLAVPRTLITEKLSSVTHMIRIYIILGLAGLLLLSVIYAVRHFLSIRRIVSSTSELQPDDYASPYRYVQDIVQSLADTRDSMQQKIILMESTYANNLLVNICQSGVGSSDDFAECRRLLDGRRDGYCLARLAINPGRSASPEFIQAEALFEQASDALTVHCSPNESLYIMPLNGSQTIEDIRRLAELHLCGFGFIGISSHQKKTHALNTAYQQAYSAAAACTPEKKCMLYTESTADRRKPLPDIELLTELRKLILAGRSDQVDQIFTQLEDDAKDLVGIEHLQTFFALRQMLLRSGIEITGEKADEEEVSFLYDEKSADSIKRLHRFALRITQSAQSVKCEGVAQIAGTIISIIDSDFGNPNLSVDYLADRLHCSAKFIYQTVKEQTGSTPGDLIEESRLRFAVELLTKTDKKNDEIAKLCGFGALNTFYRIFRKHFGNAPGEWRRQQLLKTEQTAAKPTPVMPDQSFSDNTDHENAHVPL